MMKATELMHGSEINCANTILKLVEETHFNDQEQIYTNDFFEILYTDHGKDAEDRLDALTSLVGSRICQNEAIKTACGGDVDKYSGFILNDFIFAKIKPLKKLIQRAELTNPETFISFIDEAVTAYASKFDLSEAEAE